MSIDHDMLLLTPTGYKTVGDFSGNSTSVWNGSCWTPTNIRHVGKERCVRLFLTVTRSYGETVGHIRYIMTLDLSPSGLILLADGSERAAFDLQEGDHLAPWKDDSGILYSSFVRIPSVMCTEAVDVYRAYPPCDCVVNQVMVRLHME